jgi:hypothetical protein
MGGIIAVTTRYTNGDEWRGSMWTNVLPGGLFAPPFFQPKKAEPHVKQFVARLLENRRLNPDVESLWGGHHELSPVEYGVVVVDFQTKTVISHNGYCAVTRKHVDKRDRAPSDGPAAFRKAGVTVKIDRWRSKDSPLRFFDVESFWTVDRAMETTAETRRKIQALGFTLSATEKRHWTRWLKERA